MEAPQNVFSLFRDIERPSEVSFESLSNLIVFVKVLDGERVLIERVGSGTTVDGLKEFIVDKTIDVYGVSYKIISISENFTSNSVYIQVQVQNVNY